MENEKIRVCDRWFKAGIEIALALHDGLNSILAGSRSRDRSGCVNEIALQ